MKSEYIVIYSAVHSVSIASRSRSRSRELLPSYGPKESVLQASSSTPGISVSARYYRGRLSETPPDAGECWALTARAASELGRNGARDTRSTPSPVAVEIDSHRLGLFRTQQQHPSFPWISSATTIMTDSFAVAATPQAHAADVEFLVRRGMTKGYQVLSLLAPPLYATFALSRYGRSQFSVNRLLRATWVGGSVGIVGGGAFEYVRSAYSNPEKIRARRILYAYDTSSIRADDHSTIGGALFAVLTPAMLWKRANIANLILGGAGMGSAVGLLTHYTRTVSGDPPPVVRVPDVPVPE
ncbi:uncharacterized protein FIBRA_04972 [Fibroporia radiculosa]|uniref:Uncharacterized protein n=1 Tax=Fibroporia radiculosa TaxID=599839 RepID=J4GQ60_9APHY|nr:uncharacterized protein FIBRA_04972 [Fibroporia radiculosa]CCM02860.1 predicted protein [Fibroporia radiculosa]